MATQKTTSKLKGASSDDLADGLPAVVKGADVIIVYVILVICGVTAGMWRSMGRRVVLGHGWPPRSPLTASDALGLPSTLGRRGPAPLPPLRSVGSGGAKPRPRGRLSLCWTHTGGCCSASSGTA